MASVAPSLPIAEQRERLFFLVMTVVIGALTLTGFTVNIALGRVTPHPPLIYYIHASAYTGWLGLCVVQSLVIYRNDVKLHRTLGMIALAWLPVMVALAVVMTIASIRLKGGPPVVGPSEFLFVDTMHAIGFAALTGVAIAMWRKTDWHRRLMLCALASVGSPGLGRLLVPAPLVVPYAFPAEFVAAMLFPAFALVVDLRRTGKVHPAWLWGIGAVFACLIVGEAMAVSPWGQNVTAGLLAGTPGAGRPQWGHWPPGRR